MRARAVLIQEYSAASRPTVAVQLALVVLNGELVVVGQLLSAVDLPQGKDDDVLAAVYVNDPRVAVGLTGVVDEASGVALHRCVHHVEVIDAEHVAADPLKETTTNNHYSVPSEQAFQNRLHDTDFAIIIFLPLISQDSADDRAGVLDHHLPGLNVPFAEESTTMNFRSKKGQWRELRTHHLDIYRAVRQDGTCKLLRPL